MNIINIMFAYALRTELTIPLFGKESADMNVRTEITSTAGRHIIVFTYFQTFRQLGDGDFRIQQMLHIPAQELSRLFIAEPVQ